MKNLLILITILCLSSCAENNIAPIPPDADAASKKLINKKQPNELIWNDSRYPIENANIYLVLKVENVPSGPDEFTGIELTLTHSWYVVTDGTELVDNPSSYGILMDDWKDATYAFEVHLVSFCGGIFKSGDYYFSTTLSDTSCGFRAGWWMSNHFTKFKNIDYSDPESYPLFIFSNEIDSINPLRIKGKFNDGDVISFEWEGIMKGEIINTPPSPITGWDLTIGNLPGSLYYQGVIKDITAINGWDDVWDDSWNGRVSNDNMAILKKLNKLTRK